MYPVLAPPARPPRSIAVFRALQLGDMLCALPALRALRAAAPLADIQLVGLPWAEAFARRYAHLVDGFIAFPGAAGLPEQDPVPGSEEAFYRAVQAEDFDLALQLHGDGRLTNAVVARFGARRMAGFHPAWTASPEAGSFLPYPGHGHEVRRLLALVEALGAPEVGEGLEFPLFPEDLGAFLALASGRDLGRGTYVVLHPGARDPARRWASEGFAAVGDALAARGLQVVLTGSAADADACAEVAAQMQAPAVDLAGQTTLGCLGVLLSRSALLVCSDTGVSHVAAALAVPSIVVFTASNPARWAPLNVRRHHAVPAGASAAVSIARVLGAASISLSGRAHAAA